MKPPSATPRRQRGAALLLILLIVLTAVGYSLLTRMNQTNVALARQARTEAALAEAKQALIAHALLFGETHQTNATPTGGLTEDDVTLVPGTLPCPEQSFFGNEGSESGNCGGRGASALGRLPWRSLGLPPLRDGSSECLWYAVSGSYKANWSPDVLNPDSLGQLRVLDAANNVLAGATSASRAVAAIIAPGPPLAGQDRAPVAGTGECGGNYAPANYLDRLSIGGTAYDNAVIDTTPGALSTLITGAATNFNDRIVYISREDLFGPIEKRADFASALSDPTDTDGTGPRPALAQKLAAMIARYGRNNANPQDKRLPWPARSDVADFKADTFDDISGLYAGRPPYRVGTSRVSTSNSLVAAGCSSYQCRLLTIDKAGPIAWWRVAGKPLYPPDHEPPAERGQSRVDSPDGWWAMWKDHIFYVVSPEFAPSHTPPINWASTPNPCDKGGNKCVRVNGKRFAAAIVFAGKRRAGQQRDSLSDRQNPANYLEGRNLDALQNPNDRTTRVLEYTGNDEVVCIRAEDLAIDASCTNGTE